MGKYMRKAKTAADMALMEVAQSSLGVRTRARTLALQRIQKSLPAPANTTGAGGGSYLQLRSRRLEKPPIDHSKRQKQQQSHSSRKSRMGVGKFVSEEGGSLGMEKLEEGFQENNNGGDLGGDGEASCGENVLEFEGRERWVFFFFDRLDFFFRQERRRRGGVVGDIQLGLEIRSLDAVEGQLEAGCDGFDPGGVAGEAGAGEGCVVVVVVFVEGGTGVERDRHGGRRRLSCTSDGILFLLL